MKKETPTQVFSNEFCETFKNIFFQTLAVVRFVGTSGAHVQHKKMCILYKIFVRNWVPYLVP